MPQPSGDWAEDSCWGGGHWPVGLGGESVRARADQGESRLRTFGILKNLRTRP